MIVGSAFIEVIAEKLSGKSLILLIKVETMTPRTLPVKPRALTSLHSLGIAFRFSRVCKELPI
jgi:hypothetical protein